MKPCKDCLAEIHPDLQGTALGDQKARRRPAPHPGPRCTTHHRAFVKAGKVRAHGRRVASTYGITPEQYRELYNAQGGRCAICRRATGRTRRLSVDHDHKAGCAHPQDTGCPACVRGLLCRPCNTIVGRLRDDPQAFARGAAYLTEPPARVILNPSPSVRSSP